MVWNLPQQKQADCFYIKVSFRTSVVPVLPLAKPPCYLEPFAWLNLLNRPKTISSAVFEMPRAAARGQSLKMCWAWSVCWDLECSQRQALTSPNHVQPRGSFGKSRPKKQLWTWSPSFIRLVWPGVHSK